MGAQRKEGPASSQWHPKIRSPASSVNARFPRSEVRVLVLRSLERVALLARVPGLKLRHPVLHQHQSRRLGSAVLPHHEEPPAIGRHAVLLVTGECGIARCREEHLRRAEGKGGRGANGDGDHVVFQVVEITPVAGEGLPNAEQAVASTRQNTLYSDFMGGLRDTTGMQINQKALAQFLALDTSGN